MLLRPRLRKPRSRRSEESTQGGPRIMNEKLICVGGERGGERGREKDSKKRKEKKPKLALNFSYSS